MSTKDGLSWNRNSSGIRQFRSLFNNKNPNNRLSDNKEDGRSYSSFSSSYKNRDRERDRDRDRPGQGRWMRSRYQPPPTSFSLNRGRHNRQNGMIVDKKEFEMPKTVEEYFKMTPDWYRIILRKINSNTTKEMIRTAFKPFLGDMRNIFTMYRYRICDNGQHEFFVRDSETVKLLEMNRHKIRIGNITVGLTINKRYIDEVPSHYVAKEEDVYIKNALANRYDKERNFMDLSALNCDPELNVQGIYVNLATEYYLRLVLKILSDNLPDLQQLSLASNRMRMLYGFKDCKLVSLRDLDLQTNSLEQIEQFKSLKSLTSLRQLVLFGNPIFNRYQKQDAGEAFISDMQKQIPQLLSINSMEIAPIISIGDDVNEKKLNINEIRIPDRVEENLHVIPFDFTSRTCRQDFPDQATYENVKNHIISRIEEYIFRFEHVSSRSSLSEFYVDGALYTMSCMIPEHRFKYNDDRLPFDLRQTRNIVFFNAAKKSLEYKRQTLSHGKEKIINFLQTLPTFRHIQSSLQLKIIILSKQFYIVNVTGVMVDFGGDRSSSDKSHPDRPSGKPLIRSFSSVFNLVYQNDQFFIISQQFTMFNASHQQYCRYRNQIQEVWNDDEWLKSATTITVQPSDSSEMKNLNILKLQRMTGMTLEYVEKCLEECNWNFEQSFEAFECARKNNDIPPEAFLKH
ncbi:hypothetical protein SNEBB_000905 [Seison nebaliae]|nr:hypothetical protein SNEBB_000905 [Seison nebaliae]